jgi:hypothetical protein
MIRSETASAASAVASSCSAKVRKELEPVYLSTTITITITIIIIIIITQLLSTLHSRPSREQYQDMEILITSPSPPLDKSCHLWTAFAKPFSPPSCLPKYLAVS